MSSHDARRLRDHPELGCLLGLAAQLELVPDVLAAVHTAESADALSDQARSMARVSRILSDQVRAYVGILEQDLAGRRGSRR